MGDVDATAVLSALEPLLGVGFAVNLSYLYIPWFHYLIKIGKIAKEALEEGTDSHAYLIENRGQEGPDCVSYLATLGCDDAKPKCKLFNKPWSYPLRVFTWRLDKLLSIISLAFVTTLLVVGVAHELGLYSRTLTSLTSGSKHWLLHLSALSIIIPLAMSMIAVYVSSKVKNYVKVTVGEFALVNKNKDKQVFDGKPDVPN